MKRVEFKYVLVLIAVAAMVTVLAGCPKAPAPDDTILESSLPEGAANMPEDTPADGGETVAIPDSVTTLGEAMKSFDMPSSFEMTVTGGGEDGPNSMVMKMDETELLAMRMEMDGDVMLLDMAEKVMYMYDTEENAAMKMPVEDEDEADSPNVYRFYADDLKVSGSETIDGVDCWVVEGMESDDAPDKAWIGKADGLMRQAQDGDDLLTFTYTRINEVPDSEFELPADAKIEDLGAMMEGLEGMGETTE